MTNATLNDSDLSGADFREATLHGATMNRVDLSAILVKGAKFGQNEGLNNSDRIKLKARGAILEGRINPLRDSS
ncbi:pentapeptide repeat-containing protein [Leptolyngbya sp. 7M]|nr:pentapeptide repeat-containing protein [Leptolyngbya sp. 7M]